MSETQQADTRFERWRERHVHWGMLRTLGNSRLVTSSIAWLFVVPIAARLLAPFAGRHTLDLSWVDSELDSPIIAIIALPFSWTRFYLMSWLFVIGQVVYWAACPEIVRKYANYGDYRRDHAGALQLRLFLSDALRRSTHATRKTIAQVTGVANLEAMQLQGVYDAVVMTLRTSPRTHGLEEPEDRKNRLFDAVLAVERKARQLCFWVSGVFFAGGLVLFVWVVVEGMIQVCRML